MLRLRLFTISSALLVAAGVFTVVAASPHTGQAEPDSRLTGEAAEQYSIDSTHSMALFRVQHLGAGNFYGRFNDVTGTISLTGDEADLAPSFDVTVAIESVDTGTGNLDNHLRSPDFFNQTEFPDMTFRSSNAVKRDGNVYDVTGDLSIHGVTREVTVPVEFVGSADLGRGKRVGFEAKFTVNRSDFGMNYGIERGMLGDETMIIVSLEGAIQTESGEGGSGSYSP